MPQEKASRIQYKGSPSLLLVTANVGSLFENPQQLLKPWIAELLLKAKELRPQFIALHLQEVGGKTYEKSSNCVREFVKSLCEANEMQSFSVIQIYMDEDFTSGEHYTALGNLYFGHKEMCGIRIWNFLNCSWEQAQGKNIFLGNIENIPTKEKSKFPLHFFPERKWSRKGFMRTRWDINGTVIDFVNIHLFHDASNLTAQAMFPSVYSQKRRDVLMDTLKRIHMDDVNKPAPYFIFGDFNFRCDIRGVTKELTKSLSEYRLSTHNVNSIKICFRDESAKNILTIGQKEFNHIEQQNIITGEWLRSYDCEFQVFRDMLYEYDVRFPPTYPFKEEYDFPSEYMTTRCPSWCDRILMSIQAVEIILDNSTYEIMGRNTCMGDHKPVYLSIRTKPNQGVINIPEKALKSVERVFTNILVKSSYLSEKPAELSFESQFIKYRQMQVRYYRLSSGFRIIEPTVTDGNAFVVFKETAV